MKLRKVFGVGALLLAVLAVLATAAYVWRGPLSVLVAQRVAPGRLAADTLKQLPDGLHVGLCGASSPFPDERRSGPCTVVVAGLRMAYGQDQHYRVAHHGDATVPATGSGGTAQPFQVGPAGRVTVLQDGDLRIDAFLVDHAPIQPAVGYRIQYKGRTVVISGDTKKSASVQREAQGVDLLLHEALSEPLMAVLETGAAQAGRPQLKKIFNDILNYHTTPEQAAEVARDAQVRYLVLHHIVPALPLPGMDQAFLGGAPGIYRGPIRVGLDGDFFSLLPGSTEVNFSRRF